MNTKKITWKIMLVIAFILISAITIKLYQMNMLFNVLLTTLVSLTVITICMFFFSFLYQQSKRTRNKYMFRLLVLILIVVVSFLFLGCSSTKHCSPRAMNHNAASIRMF